MADKGVCRNSMINSANSGEIDYFLDLKGVSRSLHFNNTGFYGEERVGKIGVMANWSKKHLIST